MVENTLLNGLTLGQVLAWLVGLADRSARVRMLRFLARQHRLLAERSGSRAARKRVNDAELLMLVSERAPWERAIGTVEKTAAWRPEATPMAQDAVIWLWGYVYWVTGRFDELQACVSYWCERSALALWEHVRENGEACCVPMERQVVKGMMDLEEQRRRLMKRSLHAAYRRVLVARGLLAGFAKDDFAGARQFVEGLRVDRNPMMPPLWFLDRRVAAAAGMDEGTIDEVVSQSEYLHDLVVKSALDSRSGGGSGAPLTE